MKRKEGAYAASLYPSHLAAKLLTKSVSITRADSRGQDAGLELDPLVPGPAEQAAAEAEGEAAAAEGEEGMSAAQQAAQRAHNR